MTQTTDAALVERMKAGLTLAQKRNLLALPQSLDVYATVSEMRGKGATGSGMDLLHVSNRPHLCERRWARWGSEPGQKRGEGYEYAITALGQAVRATVTP